MTENTIRGFRLSAQQSRLWSLRKAGDPEGDPFTVQLVLEMTGAIDPARLEQAAEVVIRRHEAFRTTFRTPSGLKLPVQVVADEAAPAWRVVPAADDAAALDRLTGDERAGAFDVAGSAPLRLVLATDGEGPGHLVMTASSLIADLGSLERLAREVTGAYAGEPGPAEEPLQYASYAAWQAETLADEDARLGRTYWRSQDLAAGLSAHHPLAVGGGAPFAPAVATADVPGGVVAAAEALAAERGVSPGVVCLAAWKALLARITGVDALPVAVRTHGRLDEELEEAAGPFVGFVPVAGTVEPDAAFGATLQGVSGTLGRGRDWEPYFQWEDVPASSDGGAGFFPFAYAYLEAPPAWEVGGLRCTLSRPRECADRFELELVCVRTEDGLVAEVHHDAGRVAGDAALRLAREYAVALAGAVEAPDTSFASLDILPPEERAEAIEVLNAGAGVAPTARCVHELFADHAASAPDRVAVVDEDGSVTYAQLAGVAADLAARLRSCGVGPDDRVALLLERSAGVIAGILGTLQAGAAYVPLDASLPPQRLEMLLAESGARALVTDRTDGSAPTAPGVEELPLATAGPEGAARPAVAPSSGVTPESLAYVIFTSGTTGRPKGVLVEHRQLASYVQALADRLELEPGERFATVSTFSADLGNTVVFGALCTGGTLHVLSEHRRTDPDAMAEYLDRNRVDVLKIVPSHLDALLSATRPERVLAGRRLLVGGEATRWDLVERIGRLGPRCALYNHYGPTETTVGATTHAHVSGARPEGADTLPLGTPLPGYAVYLLDRGLPVPIGVSGEAHVGGNGVARGYLDRPAETAERFVPDPFGREGARAYRTGDRVRLLPSGVLEFRGRVDHQIKIRGYRVEQGEIEAVLADHEGIAAAVVTASEGPGGVLRLAGYYVREPGADVTPDALRAYARDHLPDYMIPSVLMELAALPLTPNGKVDRRALPEPEEGSKAPRVAPSTPTERALAGIWAELLKATELSANDDFFDLGGHSLSAMQLVSRIRQTFEVELPLLTVFEAPTIAALAGRIDALGAAEGRGPVSVERVDRGQPIPASYAQERLWIFDQLHPGSSAYNIPVAIRIGGALHVAALNEAIGEIVRRHEVYRTTFESDEGRPVQVVHDSPPAPAALPVVDVSGLAEGDRHRVVRELAEADARRPFDLSTGPVWRAAVVRSADGEHALLWNQHHICSDAWSAGIFAREASGLYGAFSGGLPSGLPELAVQYADYGVWQRAWLESLGEDQLAYWKERLADVPAELELPTDRPRPREQSLGGGARVAALSPELSAGLAALGRDEQATTFVTLLTAFATLLHLHSGQRDIVIGSPTAGRSRAETEPLIGFFLNTIALRVDVDPGLTFRELLAGARGDVLAAFGNQEVPFERVVEALQVERDASRTPVFQVMFNHQQIGGEATPFPGLELGLIGVPESAAKFDLTLYSWEGPDRTSLRLAYNVDLFDDATVGAMLDRLVVLLESVVENPDRPIASLPLLPAEERVTAHAVSPLRRDGAGWAEGPEGIERTIPERFAEVVAAAPDAIAVKTTRHEWTYAALDAAARTVAGRVRSGLGDARGAVGLLFESDAPLIAAILGTLMAGCHYVPLDPANPRERLTRMADDAGVRLLLADRANVGLAGELGSSSVPVIDTGTDWPEGTGIADGEGPTPDDVAYILYTSGSTGEPKGVVQSHRNALHFARVYARNLGIRAGDRLSLLSSYGFDGSLMDIFGALLTGASLHPIDLKEGGFGAALDRIAADSITIYHSTPTVYRQIFGQANGRPPLEDVRAVVLGGEEALATDLALFKERFGSEAVLVNGLGPSESTVTLQHFMGHDTDVTRTSLPVGRPVDDTQIALIDAAGRPTDVFGEIVIRSDRVALEYWGDEALTSSAFAPVPGLEGARCYRTGDLGRRLPDGTLEFVGRKDAQLKIRGVRIEPSEVEAALLETGALRQVVVVAVAGPSGEKELVAYGVPNPGTPLSVADVRTRMSRLLPQYMVPTAFVPLDEIPYTPTGKLDAARLPEPTAVATEEYADEFEAPESHTEVAIAGVWREVLGLPEISIHDKFFDLGGQSLQALLVITKLKNDHELRVSFADLTYLTLGQIAAAATSTD